jgi:hypothetical protein
LETIYDVHFKNNHTDGYVTVEMDDTTQVTTSTSITNTISDAWHFGVKIEVEADWTLLGTGEKYKAGADFYWTHQRQKTTMEGETYTVN